MPLFPHSRFFSQEHKALAFGIVAVLMWSTVATAFKLALNHLDAWQLLFIANISSFAVLTLLLFSQNAHTPRALTDGWRRSLGFGLLNPVLYYLLLFGAYDLLPAQIAQPINYTWALVLSFMAAWRFGHKLSKSDWVASVLGYSGVLILIIPSSKADSDISWMGIALAIISTFVWASYWLMNQGDKRPPILALWQAFGFALPINGCLMISFSSIPSFETISWLAALYVGAFEMGFAFAAWLLALRLTQHTAKISHLIFLSPVISLVLIHYVLSEPIYPSTPVGLLCILIGLYLQQRTSPPTGENPKNTITYKPQPSTYTSQPSTYISQEPQKVNAREMH